MIRPADDDHAPAVLDSTADKNRPPAGSCAPAVQRRSAESENRGVWQIVLYHLRVAARTPILPRGGRNRAPALPTLFSVHGTVEDNPPPVRLHDDIHRMWRRRARRTERYGADQTPWWPISDRSQLYS